MRKLAKLGMFTFLSVALATNLTGCSDDDPDYSNVTPPTVPVSHSISGRVTSMDGQGLSATVSMNGTATQTDAEGMFAFEDVAAGSYTLTASAEGKQTKETTVTVEESGSSANVVWNISLPNEGTTVEIAANGDTKADVTSETIEGNEEGAVTVEVTVPLAANSVENLANSSVNSASERPWSMVDDTASNICASSVPSVSDMSSGVEMASVMANTRSISRSACALALAKEAPSRIRVFTRAYSRWVSRFTLTSLRADRSANARRVTCESDSSPVVSL